jgi:hypothetical protein
MQMVMQSAGVETFVQTNKPTWLRTRDDLYEDGPGD